MNLLEKLKKFNQSLLSENKKLASTYDKTVADAKRIGLNEDIYEDDNYGHTDETEQPVVDEANDQEVYEQKTASARQSANADSQSVQNDGEPTIEQFFSNEELPANPKIVSETENEIQICEADENAFNPNISLNPDVSKIVVGSPRRHSVELPPINPRSLASDAPDPQVHDTWAKAMHVLYKNIDKILAGYPIYSQPEKNVLMVRSVDDNEKSCTTIDGHERNCQLNFRVQLQKEPVKGFKTYTQLILTKNGWTEYFGYSQTPNAQEQNKHNPNPLRKPDVDKLFTDGRYESGGREYQAHINDIVWFTRFPYQDGVYMKLTPDGWSKCDENYLAQKNNEPPTKEIIIARVKHAFENDKDTYKNGELTAAAKQIMTELEHTGHANSGSPVVSRSPYAKYDLVANAVAIKIYNYILNFANSVENSYTNIEIPVSSIESNNNTQKTRSKDQKKQNKAIRITDLFEESDVYKRMMQEAIDETEEINDACTFFQENDDSSANEDDESKYLPEVDASNKYEPPTSTADSEQKTNAPNKYEPPASADDAEQKPDESDNNDSNAQKQTNGQELNPNAETNKNRSINTSTSNDAMNEYEPSKDVNDTNESNDESLYEDVNVDEKYNPPVDECATTDDNDKKKLNELEDKEMMKWSEFKRPVDLDPDDTKNAKDKKKKKHKSKNKNKKHKKSK